MTKPSLNHLSKKAMNIQRRNTAPLRERPNSEMSILEKPLEWLQEFQRGWLANLEKTGQPDWGKYIWLRNLHAPSGGSIQLAESRLLLISSAGAYLRDQQEPFNTRSPLGDYSVRLVPRGTGFEQIEFANSHYDHTFVQTDPQVLLPMLHLEELAAEGKIGGLAPVIVSFNGYQPNAIRVVKELIPQILRVAREQDVTAALLISAGMLCIQSLGLIARALEVNNIATTLANWSSELGHHTAPPRVINTGMPSGSTLGLPGDPAYQRQVLERILSLIEHDAPVEMDLTKELG